MDESLDKVEESISSDDADSSSTEKKQQAFMQNLLKGAGLVGSALAGSAVMPSVIGAEDHAVQSAAIPLREALETLTEGRRLAELPC